jgi:hypothetical protein
MPGKPPNDQGAGAGTAAGQQGEKVQYIQKLLEIFNEIEKKEQSPSGKAKIQQAATLMNDYLSELKGETTKTTSQPATGEAGSGGGMGGAAGSTPSAGVGAPEPAGAMA